MNTWKSEAEKTAKSAIDQVAGNAPDYNKEIEFAGLKLKRREVIDPAKVLASDPRCQLMQKIMDMDPGINKIVTEAVKWFNEILILNCIERYFYDKSSDKSIGSVASRQHRNDDLKKIDEMIAQVRVFIDTHDDIMQEVLKSMESCPYAGSELPCRYVLKMTSGYEVVK